MLSNVNERTINFFIENEFQRKLLEKAEELANIFSNRAEKHDREGSFPFENFRDLKEANFLTLTIPKQYGGEEISLYSYLLLIERLGRGDASTALGLGWHLGILMNLYQTNAWSEEDYRRICEKVVREGALINAISSEPETGSPSRGGKPQTTATLQKDKWVISGRKTWSTLSPALDYFIVSASIVGTEDVGAFIVPKDTRGIEIEETWDSLGMRGTGSHDVVLKEVAVAEDAIVERRKWGTPSTKSGDGGWLLHIAACYIGVAYAARDYALQFAREYQPNSLQHPIAQLPAVKEKIGKIELKLYTARTLLYSIAKKWDGNPELRQELKAELAATKYVATNLAVEIIDLAMRIVGGRSLLKKYPLERYYRDVRAGLHNPPMDDVTLSWLASKAIEEER